MNTITKKIEAKKLLSVQFPTLNDNLKLTFNSIENLFKNQLKCKIYNTSFKIHSDFYHFCLKCKIKDYVSSDFLLDNLGKYFSNYHISKEESKRALIFEADIKFVKNCVNTNEIYEQSEKTECNENFVFYIKNKLINNKELNGFIENKTNKKIKKIQGIIIDDFYFFVISYCAYVDHSDAIEYKSCITDYYELESYFENL